MEGEEDEDMRFGIKLVKNGQEFIIRFGRQRVG